MTVGLNSLNTDQSLQKVDPSSYSPGTYNPQRREPSTRNHHAGENCAANLHKHSQPRLNHTLCYFKTKNVLVILKHTYLNSQGPICVSGLFSRPHPCSKLVWPLWFPYSPPFSPPPLSLAPEAFWKLILYLAPRRPCHWSMFWSKFTHDYYLLAASGNWNEEFEIQVQAFTWSAGIIIFCSPDSKHPCAPAVAGH